MPAFTPNLNLRLPGGGSLGIGGTDEQADIDMLNQNFQKIDTFAGTAVSGTNKVFQYAGIAADRSVIVPTPNEGDEFYATDTKVLYKYIGSDWVDGSAPLSVGRVCSLTSSTSTSNGTVILTWVASNASHGLDTGGFLDTDTPTRVNLKKVGWYEISYTVRTNGVAALSIAMRLNGAGLPYGLASGSGVSGSASHATRTLLLKATAVTDYLDIQVTSTATASGSHNIVVRYLGVEVS